MKFKVILTSLLISCSAFGSDIQFIRNQAISQGINPDLAVAVAKVESNLDHSVVGTSGEIGLFQLHPKYFPKDLAKDKEMNVRMAIAYMTYLKKHCPVKERFGFILCYNQGFRKPKYPTLMPYYRKVMSAMEK